MIDERFFEEKFSALKAHIDTRIDALEKRMETAEKLMQQIWVEVEAIRSDMRLIAEGHVMLTEKFGRFESEYIRHATEMRHDVLTLYKLTFGELERRVRELEKLKKVS
jgi:uncharacterized coiled-coil protein SlyX